MTVSGANMVQKKMVTSSCPTLTLCIEGDCLVVKREVGPKTIVTKFPLDGTAVEDDTPTGDKAMVSRYVMFSISHILLLRYAIALVLCRARWLQKNTKSVSGYISV